MNGSAQKRRRRGVWSGDGGVGELTLGQVTSDRLDGPAARRGELNLSWLGLSKQEGGAQRVDEITESMVDHAYGLSKPSCFHRCANRHVGDDKTMAPTAATVRCTEKNCQDNPWCLNHLGSGQWFNESAFKNWRRVNKMTEINMAMYRPRQRDVPTGLLNLGATCYVNALLQVWFHNPAFREAMYHIKADNPDSLIAHFQRAFAHMQLGRYDVYHPGPLIQRLGLDTKEHQDAQEFSSLCLQHLENAIKAQAEVGHASMPNIVASIFEGKMAMGNRCLSCNKKSRNESGFSEIQLSLVNGATVESLLESSLKSELLSGENQYHCLNCEGLRDAERFTSIVELPPFLHLSLLRFAFDPKTMIKSKSHKRIKYPAWIDMRPFVSESDTEEPLIYDLVAVLSHRGKDSDWGHYIADVYKVEDSKWYTFNDETVVHSAKMDADTKRQNQPSDSISQYFVSTFDTQDTKVAAESKSSSTDTDDATISDKAPYLTTTEAYMLVYALRQSLRKRDVMVPEPLQEAIKADDSVAQAHEIEARAVLEAQLARFNAERELKLDIFRTWMEPADHSYFVATDWLERWCLQGLQSPTIPDVTRQRNILVKTEQVVVSPLLDVEEECCNYAWMKCSHGNLSLTSLHDVKIVPLDSLRAIEAQGLPCPCAIPCTRTCKECCKTLMKNRIFSAQHEKRVHYFKQYQPRFQADIAYTVSSQWLQQWLKMDPFPEAGIYSHDIRPDNECYLQPKLCSHGKVAPTAGQSWAGITEEQYDLLRFLYQGLDLAAMDDFCLACKLECHGPRMIASALAQSKHLSHLLSPKLVNVRTAPRITAERSISLSDDYFLVSRAWFDKWFSWVKSPKDVGPPGPIDNGMLFCQHQLLRYDPFEMRLTNENPDHYVMLSSKDWNALVHHHGLVTLPQTSANGYLGWLKGRLEISIKRIVHLYSLTETAADRVVCGECLSARIMAFTETTLFVHFEKSRADVFLERNAADHVEVLADWLESRTKGRPKRSLKSQREAGPFAIQVAKDSTVKDIKVKIMEVTKISPIYQALFWNKDELEDNSATAMGLKLSPGCMLRLIHLEEQTKDHHAMNGNVTATNGLGRNGRAGFSGTNLATLYNDGRDEAQAFEMALQASLGMA